MSNIDQDEMFSSLRACVLSSKGGVNLRSLNRDYKSLVGTNIPYQQLGFKKLEDFVCSIPDLNLKQDSSGEYVVQARPNKNTLHLFNLVSMQKKSKKKTNARSKYSHYNNFSYKSNSSISKNLTYHNEIKKLSSDIQQKQQRLPKVPAVPQSNSAGNPTKSNALAVQTTAVVPKPNSAGNTKKSDTLAVQATTFVPKPNSAGNPTKSDTLAVQATAFVPKPNSTGNPTKSDTLAVQATAFVPKPNSAGNPTKSDTLAVQATAFVPKPNSTGNPTKSDTLAVQATAFVPKPNSTGNPTKSDTLAVQATAFVPKPNSTGNPTKSDTLAVQATAFVPKPNSAQNSTARETPVHQAKAAVLKPNSTGNAATSNILKVQATTGVPKHNAVQNPTANSTLSMQTAANRYTSTAASSSERTVSFKNQPAEGISSISNDWFDNLRIQVNVEPKRKPSQSNNKSLWVKSHYCLNNNNVISQNDSTVASQIPTTTSASTQYGDYETELNRYTVAHDLEQPQYLIQTCLSGKKKAFICKIKVGTLSVTDSSMRENSEKAAKELVAKLMLNKLMSIEPTDNFVTFTSNEDVALARIHKILEQHIHGLWTFELASEYQKMYLENLPSDWLSLVKGNDIYEVIKWNNEKIIVQLNSDCHVPDVLSLPSTEDWILHVTYVESTVGIWARILGEGYSDQFEEMENEMNLLRDCLNFGLKKVRKGRYMLVLLFETIYRAEILEWQEGQSVALCFLPDIGTQEKIPLTDMTTLPSKFTRLPFQAFKCVLHGLQRFDNDTARILVSKELRDRIVVAKHKESIDGILVKLYDTQTELGGINLNKKLIEKLVRNIEPCLPRVSDLEQMRVSYISPSCELYVQPQVGTVYWLEDQLETYKNDISTERVACIETSNLHLAYCSGLEFVSQPDKDVSDDEQKNIRRLCRVVVNSVTLSKSSNSKTLVDVFCVDYGNILKIADTKLKLFPSSLQSLMDIPFQAVRCKMHGVPLNPEMIVTVRTIIKFKELLKHNRMAVVRTVKQGSMYDDPQVVLISRTSENYVWSINDTIAMDVSLFDMETPGLKEKLKSLDTLK